MIFKHILNKDNKVKEISNNYYFEILNLSNKIINTKNLELKKDFKVSFELVSLLMLTYITVIKDKKITDYSQINQLLINNFISDLDESLRKEGIGDMSIGKYVKSYVKKFYFRLSKFDEFYNRDEYHLYEKYLVCFDFIEEHNVKDLSKILSNIYKNLKNSISYSN